MSKISSSDIALSFTNYFWGAMIKNLSIDIEETGNKYVRKGEKTHCSNGQQSRDLTMKCKMYFVFLPPVSRLYSDSWSPCRLSQVSAVSARTQMFMSSPSSVDLEQASHPPGPEWSPTFYRDSEINTEMLAMFDNVGEGEHHTFRGYRVVVCSN